MQFLKEDFMSSDGENWKIIALTGTLSVAISSAVAATETSPVPNAAARLQMVRNLAQQDRLVARDGDKTILVAQTKFNKNGGDEYNKVDSSSGKR
jgi:hypothetical protein